MKNVVQSLLEANNAEEVSKILKQHTKTEVLKALEEEVTEAHFQAQLLKEGYPSRKGARNYFERKVKYKYR